VDLVMVLVSVALLATIAGLVWAMERLWWPHRKRSVSSSPSCCSCTSWPRWCGRSGS